MILINNFNSPLMDNNYYLIKEDNKHILIDCPKNLSSFISYLQTNNIKLDAVILTHIHIDHILGLNELYEANIIDHVYASFEEVELLSDNSKCGNMSSFMDINFEYKGNVLPLEDFKLFNLNYKYIYGHSKQGAVYIFDDCIFTGDILFKDSIGRSDFCHGDQKKLLQGIKDHILTLDDSFIVYPGHGPISTIAYERQNNPFLKEL
ncbi:MAG: MBL fold metallo-hydrolase [Mycoplasmatales bacterium]